MGIYRLLPSPALLALTAAQGQQEAATYQTHIARFSFLLQVRFCKFMRSKLCRHNTCVCPFAFSSFLTNNQECFCSCPFSSYPFPFSSPLALYGTITFVVLKDLIVPSTLFYNISTVFFKKKKISGNTTFPPVQTVLMRCLVSLQAQQPWDGQQGSKEKLLLTSQSLCLMHNRENTRWSQN